jgi:hypothetical protein
LFQFSDPGLFKRLVDLNAIDIPFLRQKMLIPTLQQVEFYELRKLLKISFEPNENFVIIFRLWVIGFDGYERSLAYIETVDLGADLLDAVGDLVQKSLCVIRLDNTNRSRPSRQRMIDWRHSCLCSSLGRAKQSRE